ncbi:hypothetical protein [Marinicella litoralis]
MLNALSTYTGTTDVRNFRFN